MYGKEHLEVKSKQGNKVRHVDSSNEKEPTKLRINIVGNIFKWAKR